MPSSELSVLLRSETACNNQAYLVGIAEKIIKSSVTAEQKVYY